MTRTTPRSLSTMMILLAALALGACDKKQAVAPGGTSESVNNTGGAAPAANTTNAAAPETTGTTAPTTETTGATVPTPEAPKAAAMEDLKGTYSFTVKGGETADANEDLVSTLAITAASEASLTFKMSLSMDNGHACALDGPAKAVAGKPGVFEYREDNPDEDLKCTLRLTVTPEAIAIVDVEDGCRGYYCGARGSISEVTFKRASRKP